MIPTGSLPPAASNDVEMADRDGGPGENRPVPDRDWQPDPFSEEENDFEESQASVANPESPTQPSPGTPAATPITRQDVLRRLWNYQPRESPDASDHPDTQLQSQSGRRRGRRRPTRSFPEQAWSSKRTRSSSSSQPEPSVVTHGEDWDPFAEKEEEPSTKVLG